MSYLKYAGIESSSGYGQASASESFYEGCKRVTQNRRTLSFKSVWHSMFTGRRRVIQRQATNKSGYIIDTHESWLWLLTLGVFLMSISDACLTLVLLQYGAVEVNPFMAILLDGGVSFFFWVKFTTTVVPLMVLVVFKNFIFLKYFNGYHLIALIFSLYTCLIIYEFTLLDNI